LDNDTTPTGHSLSASLVSNPANGQVTLQSDGSFVYTPNEHFYGVDSFTYAASDGHGSSDIATVTITVVYPPYALNDSYQGNKNLPLVISAASGVLQNDVDPMGYALSVTLADGPDYGTLVLNPDGSFTYTPALNFIGTDVFVYTAHNGQGYSTNATVTIVVNP
jgi:hypothetical protein